MKKSILTTAITLAIAGSVCAEPSERTFERFEVDLLTQVTNQCIVRLNDNVNKSDVRSKAMAFANKSGAEIKHVYSNTIKGFTLKTSCTSAQKSFGKSNEIMYFEPDSIVRLNKGKPGGGSSDPQQASYGTARVGGPVDGTGYTAWIIDTGIDLDHPDLNVDTTNGFTAISRGGMNDENGHGSHVAGTIGAIDNTIGALGVAPNTTVIPVRVLDRRGSGSTSGVIAGVDHVGANASPGDCANMSLGGGVSQTLDDAVIAASEASGAFFVLAAGNDGDDANNSSPARANGPNVWTISAIDSNDTMPSWSNYGNPPVDYAAPGVSIFSLWKDGGTNTISGTSMASPHACAVIMMTGGSPASDGTANNDPDGNPDPIVHL